MIGTQVLIGTRPDGRHVAALMVDGRLDDLLIDPEIAPPAAPEAIHCAIAGRPMKGQGGTMVDLGSGASGYLRGTRTPPPGRPLLVQVTGWAEDGKAPPVTTRLRLKGRYVILTPGAPGLNLSRSLQDEDARTALEDLVRDAMAGADETLGLIVRSAAGEAGRGEIKAEIAAFLAEWAKLQAGLAAGRAGLLLAAPGAAALARRDWCVRGAEEVTSAEAFAASGVIEAMAALASPVVPTGEGFMSVEATRALVAVDVNTGGDTSPAAGLKATIAALRDLPRQLRLRGLGGQIVIDPAPVPRNQRKQVETVLAAAFRGDAIETSLAGWTPLGHIELQRKRARRPLGPEEVQIAWE